MKFLPRRSRGEQCDAGHCKENSTIDLGRHYFLTGIPGHTRYICCWHARGLKFHRRTEHDCTAVEVAL